MKRSFFFIAALITLVAFFAQAQQSANTISVQAIPSITVVTPSLPDPPPILTAISVDGNYTVVSDHYHVESQISQEDAILLSQELESRFAVYNTLFRFVPNGVKTNLRVTAFGNKESYDAYIQAKLGASYPDGALYIHYSQENLRELLINRGTDSEALLLPNQAFIQYLRAFVSYPPEWFNKGFALYYYTLTFDPVNASSDTKTPGPLVFDENLSLLESVRTLINSTSSLKTLFLDNAPSSSLSWALVSFCLKSGNADYFRTLTESFIILDKDASTEANTEKVLERMLQYTNWDAFERDFKAYINSKKTFNELIEEGLASYNAHDFIRARNAFAAASGQQPAHYLPYYYLGLLSYDEKEFDKAKDYYEKSFDKSEGSDSAIIALALGFNMAAAGRNSEAITWLQKASAKDPNQTVRINNIIRTLQ